MKFGYTIIYVKHVQETISFYENAFGFQSRFVTPEGDYGELISGDTTLSFASVELGKSNFQKGFIPIQPSEQPIGVELAFVSENVEVDFQKALDNGAIEFEPLTQKPWGQKVGYVRDNNGFLIEICSPISTE